jgi:hypothetical protein
MIVHTIHHTAIITIGSIAVAKFFTILSISLLYFIDIFDNKFGILPVCSQIFITEESSIGKYGLSFFCVIKFIHISSLKFFQMEMESDIFNSSFS